MIQRKDAKATDLAKWNPTEKVFRISAPTHYRTAFLNDGEEDTTARVLSTLASWKTVPVSLLTGGSWKWEWGKCSEQLVGHLKMSTENAKKLEAESGKHGIFVTRTNVHQRNEEVFWVDKKPDEITLLRVIPTMASNPNF